MRTHYRLFIVCSFAACLASGPATAQQPPPPQQPVMRTPPVGQPSPYMEGNARTTAPIVINQTQPNPYSYGGGYGYPYPTIQTPINGYLSGVADVTNANGQYLSQVQQARLQQTQADSAKLDFRMKLDQDQRYLKSLQPTPEQIRQKEIADAIQRARNNPPAVEIYSGQALNSLLTAIQRSQLSGVRGPMVPIQPETLRHINLTTGVTRAGSGVVRDLTKFEWPLALVEMPFDDNRAQVEKLGKLAADQAGSGAVEPKVINGLQKAVNGLIATTKDQVANMTPTEYVQAMRYLRELNEALPVLQDPNVANYVNGKWAAQGNNIAEMVQDMTNRGLKFAAAGSGDEPWYTVLHSAMVQYDYVLVQLAAR